MNTEKKEFILLSVITLFIALILLGFLLFLNRMDEESPQEVSKSYQALAIKNSLATPVDFRKEKSPDDSDKNIKKSLSLLTESAKIKMGLINYSSQDIDNDFKQADTLIKNKEYGRSLDTIKKALARTNQALDIYYEQHAEDQKAIEFLLREYTGTGIHIANYRFYDDWALVTLVPPDLTTDPANIFLRKEDKIWTKVLGPGTFFDKKKLKSLNIPDQISGLINTAPEEKIGKFIL